MLITGTIILSYILCAVIGVAAIASQEMEWSKSLLYWALWMLFQSAIILLAVIMI